MFQFPGRTRKNFIPENFSRRVLTETWDRSWFKKGLLEKQQSAPNTCDISPLKKIFFQNLINRCICQMSLKYIKLVIPKILFILVLYIFNFNLKLSDTPQQNYPLPSEKTFLTPPFPHASKDFSKLFNRLPIWRRGVHAMLYI